MGRRRRGGRRAAGARGVFTLIYLLFFSTPTYFFAAKSPSWARLPPGGRAGLSPEDRRGRQPPWGTWGPPGRQFQAVPCWGLGAPSPRLVSRPAVVHRCWTLFPALWHLMPMVITRPGGASVLLGSAAAGFWGRGGSHPGDRDRRLPHNRLEPPPRPLGPPAARGLAVTSGHAALSQCMSPAGKAGKCSGSWGSDRTRGAPCGSRGLCSRTAKANVSLNIPCTAPLERGARTKEPG